MIVRNKFKGLFKLATSPAGVVLGVSLLLLLLNLYLTHRIRPYNSDDVTWQNILFTWRPFSGHEVILGSSDNMILKVPFFMVLERFFTPGRALLLLESSILAALGFTLFYISALYFLVKAKIKLTYLNLLPFVWLASFGYAMAQMYLNPIWRGFEIGLVFVTFMVVAMIYNKDVAPLKSWVSRLVTLVLAMGAGFLAYSDPYYLYFAIVPVVLFSAVLLFLKKIATRQALIVAGLIVVLFVSAKITGLIVSSAGAKMADAYPLAFTEFDQFFINIALAAHAILAIFGGDFFGEKLVSLTSLSALVNASIVAFIFYQVYQLRRSVREAIARKATNLPQLWTMFFGLLGVFAAALYIVSTVAVNDLRTYRYFIVLVLACIIFLAITLASLKKNRRFITMLLVASIFLNITVAFAGSQGLAQPGSRDDRNILQPGSEGNRANVRNFEFVHAMESRGLTKGFGNYWQTTINTYLSDGRVQFLPVICDKGQTKPFYWLVDPRQFPVPSQRTFYILDPDIKHTNTCTHEQLIQQFGEPQDFFRLSNKTILIYDYDLYARMGQ